MTRRALRRLRARIATGDRAGALRDVDAMLEPVKGRGLFDVDGQLVLGFVTFRCRTLDVIGMSVRVCVTRQKVTDTQRTQQFSRGQGTDYPSCDSRTCALGRRIREAIEPKAQGWRGVGFGGRFVKDRPSREVARQTATRDRLRIVGLLDEVPTLDAGPVEVEE